MKRVLLCLFLTCAINSYAQQKKDSKIIVSVTDTTKLFNRLALAFIDKGYSFENKDQQLGFISTTEKPIKNSAGSIKIRVVIKDSTITFSGLFASDVEMKIMGTKLERTFDPLTYWGANNGSYKVCWREIESIAKQFGDKITYSK